MQLPLAIRQRVCCLGALVYTPEGPARALFANRLAASSLLCSRCAHAAASNLLPEKRAQQDHLLGVACNARQATPQGVPICPATWDNPERAVLSDIADAGHHHPRLPRRRR